MHFIVCQIGAREHYAIARALENKGQLSALSTDFWIQPGQLLGRLPVLDRLRDRYHTDLNEASVLAPNLRMLALEIRQRLGRKGNWAKNMQRNQCFQRLAIRELAKFSDKNFASEKGGQPSLFSYSYAAGDLFRFAKSRGWKTVLGQIDPGPEEERIVGREHERYPHLASRWKPAPTEYWDDWRKEIELSDRIIANSEWSRECLIKEGILAEKVEVVPLVYQGRESGIAGIQRESRKKSEPFRLLFLGQVNLRKGIGRLLDAMRLLRDEAVELVLVGPSEISESEWADLPRVSWLGSVPRSEVVDHYERADAFVLPTLSDGYAITQLEALSHGLPVLASKHCGGAVVDGVNGRILADLEPETIAETVLEMTKQSFPNVAPLSFGLEELADALTEPGS